MADPARTLKSAAAVFLETNDWTGGGAIGNKRRGNNYTMQNAVATTATDDIRAPPHLKLPYLNTATWYGASYGKISPPLARISLPGFGSAWTMPFAPKVQQRIPTIIMTDTRNISNLNGEKLQSWWAFVPNLPTVLSKFGDWLMTDH